MYVNNPSDITSVYWQWLIQRVQYGLYELLQHRKQYICFEYAASDGNEDINFGLI